MNCQDVQTNLDAYTLGALDPAEAEQVRLHSLVCKACAAAQAEREALAAALQTKAKNRAQGHAERMLQAWRSAQQRQALRTSRRRRWVRLALPLAACVLLMLGGVRLLSRHQTPTAKASAPIEWVQEGIEATVALASPYPIVTAKHLFALQHEASATRVAAFDRTTGARHWTSPFEATGPLVSNTRHVYAWQRASNGNSTLVALDTDTGRHVWQFEVPTQDRRPVPRFPVALYHEVLILGNGSELIGLNAANGEVLWSASLDGQPILALKQAATTVFAVSATSMAALNPDTGSPKWIRAHERRLATFIEPLIEVEGQTLYLAHRDFPAQGRLAAYQESDGQQIWEQAVGAPFALRAYNGRVYLNAAGMTVISGQTGERLWAADIEGCSPIAVHGSTVYMVGGSQQQTVIALDIGSGQPVWVMDLPGSCSGLVIDGDHGFVSGHGGGLYALTLGGRG